LTWFDNRLLGELLNHGFYAHEAISDKPTPALWRRLVGKLLADAIGTAPGTADAHGITW
jgi:hypothetical protein